MQPCKRCLYKTETVRVFQSELRLSIFDSLHVGVIFALSVPIVAFLQKRATFSETMLCSYYAVRSAILISIRGDYIACICARWFSLQCHHNIITQTLYTSGTPDCLHRACCICVLSLRRLYVPPLHRMTLLTFRLHSARG